MTHTFEELEEMAESATTTVDDELNCSCEGRTHKYITIKKKKIPLTGDYCDRCAAVIKEIVLYEISKK